MKKIIILFLIVLLIFSFASCKRKEPEVAENSSVSNENSSIVSYPIYEVTSPIYTDLTLEHFKKLYVGMPFEEAIKIVGAPHKTETFENIQGITVRHYYTAINGREYTVHYKNGAINIIQYPYYYTASPVRNDLTMEDVDKLYISMPYEEAIEILGAPHDYRGSGIVRDVYKLADGGEVSLHYSYGCINSFFKRDKNGETIKIQ